MAKETDKAILEFKAKKTYVNLGAAWINKFGGYDIKIDVKEYDKHPIVAGEYLALYVNKFTKDKNGVENPKSPQYRLVRVVRL